MTNDWILKAVAAAFSVILVSSDKTCGETSGKEQETRSRRMTIYRNLKDYSNADNRTADGLDNDTDDTIAFQAAFADGPGIVFVPPGFYRCGDLLLPAGVTLKGAGPATVIRSNGAKKIFNQHGSDWALRDFVLDGEAQGNWKLDMDDPGSGWKTQKDLGYAGIFLRGCTGFEISGVVVRNFSGTGIHIEYTGKSPYCRWATRGNIFNLVASGNHVGLRFDERAEYMNAAMLTCQGNVIGCVINAGNVKITNSNFTNNETGMIVEDKDNGSHGSISNCLLNHNRLSLLCRNVKYGMIFGNCCFFGPIRIENSTGVNIADGIIGSGLTIEGDGANRFAGNYITRENPGFKFPPSTTVAGNYTPQGPWQPDIPPVKKD